MESKAIRSMAQLLTDGGAGREIVDLWEEYESGQTPEAKVVKDLDKFDMILQVTFWGTELAFLKSVCQVRRYRIILLFCRHRKYKLRD